MVYKRNTNKKENTKIAMIQKAMKRLNTPRALAHSNTDLKIKNFS